MSIRKNELQKGQENEEHNLSPLSIDNNPKKLNTKLWRSNTILLCTSCCCCSIFIYLTIVGSFMGVFYVETADVYLGSCDAPREVYQIKNACQSNNEELDLKVNSSVRTRITQCTTGKSSAARCEMPKTFVFYDLLSMSRMNNRVGYSSQCALEGSQPVVQKEVWMQIPLEPNNVHWSDGKGMSASINGSLLAYVPLCNSNFVKQPIGVNFTMHSLNEVLLQGFVDIPIIKAVIEGTVFMKYNIEGWYDYSTVQDIKSSASFSLDLLASVFATDILIEHPSRNGLIAVKSGSVSASLNISELGVIYDFSFSMKDSSFCNGSPYGFNLCPYIESFIYNTYGPELLNLVVLYAEAGFAGLANKLAVKVQNATYTEVDS